MSQSAIAIDIQKLNTKIQSNKEEIKRIHDTGKMDKIEVIKSRIERKKRELKNYETKFFKFWYRREMRDLQTDILKLDKITEEHESAIRKIRELEEENEGYEKKINAYSRPAWRGLPLKLNDKVFTKYANLLREFENHITPDVHYINITMIGETGAGKSSYLNTLLTALEDSKNIKDTFRVSRSVNVDTSATLRIHVVPFHLQGATKPLVIKFYDIPGIGRHNDVRQEEIEMILNGELKPGFKITKASEMKKNTDLLRCDPDQRHTIHCILYVVRATTNTSIEMTESLKIMQQIRKSKNLEDDVRQFALVTAIDEIGVPNDDMENAYIYPCITTICEKVCTVLDLDQRHVFPVSNYFEEETSTSEKNAMSLLAFWRICSSGRDYINRKWGKRESFDDFEN